MNEDALMPRGVASSREREFAQTPEAARSTNARRWLPGFALVLLVLAVYWPVFRGGFVWDDAVLIDRNSLVKGEANLLSIWFREDFPLSIVALWLQWLAWGKHAAGYHVANVLLHAASVLLLWRVLVRLRIQGAWLAAALFAVHPVAVASAAWISELKNTLSLLFFLLSLRCFLKFQETAVVGRARLSQRAVREDAGCGALGQTRPTSGVTEGGVGLEFRNPKSEIEDRRFYWLALGAFLLALLSKTSTVMLPVVLLACVWWQRGRVDRRDVLGASPFFLLALAFGLMTIWFQTHHVIAGQTVQAEGLWARLAGAGWALWFYLGEALLPLNLTMIYPRWEINAASLVVWLPLAGWGALLCAVWWFRHGWGRHVFFALVCFSALLFPVLGFFDMYFLSMSRVSDHFAYLSLMPVAALAAAFSRVAPSARFRRAIGAVVVVGLSVLSVQRARVFATDEGLWRDTLAKNPKAWVAHNNLGCILAEQNKLDEAAGHFEASLQTNPRNAEAHRNLGKALVLKEQFARAEEHLRTAVQLNPKDAEAQRTRASALAGLGRSDEAVKALHAALRVKPDAETHRELANLMRRLGDFREAVAQLRLAVAAQPDSAELLNNLAWLLATASDASLRNGAEAVQLAERACRLTGEKEAAMVAVRAAAYAEAERFAEAVASAEKALTLANASGNTQFVQLNQQLLRLYRTRLPYHEPPPPEPSNR